MYLFIYCNLQQILVLFNCLRLLLFFTFCPYCVFQVLQEKFTEFASETGSVGQERVTAVNQMVDELIDYGHSEAATIAEWKDGVNEAWADLLELMETRAQMLAASHQLHKFFFDCREVMPTQFCFCFLFFLQVNTACCISFGSITAKKAVFLLSIFQIKIY